MAYTLQQAVEFMKENGDNPMALAENKELLDYVESIQEMGLGALSPLGNENLNGAVGLVQAAVLTNLLFRGKMKDVLMLSANMDTFDDIIVTAMQFTVGMAITEEWR